MVTTSKLAVYKPNFVDGLHFVGERLTSKPVYIGGFLFLFESLYSQRAVEGV